MLSDGINRNPLLEAFGVEVTGTLDSLLKGRYKSLSAVEVTALLAKMTGMSAAALVKNGLPQPAAMHVIAMNLNMGFLEALHRENDNGHTTH